MESVLKKLNLTNAQLNSLYTANVVGGETGKQTALKLCQRYNLDIVEPLGQQLVEREILTEEEGTWLDDDE